MIKSTLSPCSEGIGASFFVDLFVSFKGRMGGWEGGRQQVCRFGYVYGVQKTIHQESEGIFTENILPRLVRVLPILLAMPFCRSGIGSISSCVEPNGFVVVVGGEGIDWKVQCLVR